MSIILKALRKKQNTQASQESSSSGEGLSLGKEGFVKHKEPLFNIRTIVLLCILILALGFTLFVGTKKENTPPAPQPASPADFARNASLNPPVPVQSFAQQAKKAFEEGNLDESLGLYQKALLQAPNDSRIHNDIGFIFLKKELYASAEKHFTLALELNEECAECFNNLGYLKTLLGQDIEAERYLKKASELKKDYPDPHFNLAVLYEKNGDLGGAIQSYQKFILQHPDPQSEVPLRVKNHLNLLLGQE